MIKQNCRFTADVCQICDAYYLEPSNPLLPRSDKYLISPCNITPESNIKVMSSENEGNDHLLKETLTRLLNKFFLSISSLGNERRTVYRIWILILGYKRLTSSNFCQ